MFPEDIDEFEDWVSTPLGNESVWYPDDPYLVIDLQPLVKAFLAGVVVGFILTFRGCRGR